MGRGDKRTRKGKIFKGSFGNSRPKNAKKNVAAPKKAKAVKAEAPAKKAAVKKAPAKKAAAKKKTEE